MKLPWYKWIADVENTVSGEVSSCVARDWDEDFVTRSWLRALIGKYPYVEVIDLPDAFKVQWDAYKAVGTTERKHGDIAILVRVKFKHGRHLEGVAFMEAKRIYESSYDAIKWPQLKYHSSNTANHRLLLYDKEPLNWENNSHWSDDHSWPYRPGFWPWRFGRVHAFCLPSVHALALGSIGRDLNDISQPLSWQLCCRYLRGLDLDYSPHLVEAVKQAIPAGVNYLIVANVSMNPDSPVRNDDIQLNRDALRPIEPE